MRSNGGLVFLDRGARPRRASCPAWGAALLLSACDSQCGDRAALAAEQAESVMSSAPVEALVLTPPPGNSPLDERIRALQRRVPTSRVPAEELERLGWTFIARARELDDPGSYNLALATARMIEERAPSSHAALLLRGHALHSLHHFAEAERAARWLVAERGLAVDHGLLGDILVDRGDVEEAVAAYQQMVDLRPDTHSYARAAYVRYLKGDLAGALAAMQMATTAASARNRETYAWTWARLAQYQLEAQETELAEQSVQRALAVMPDSQPALRMRAILHLAQSNFGPAIAVLRKATARSPHPELLWMLAEALEARQEAAQAAEVRARLLEVGATEDPRTFALYLACRNEQLGLAERLVREELMERHDVHTHGVLGLVLSARGDHAQALESARRSLSAGTPDPRLYYQAGVVAMRAGARGEAAQWLARARSGQRLLLPSQRTQLSALVGGL